MGRGQCLLPRGCSEAAFSSGASSKVRHSCKQSRDPGLGKSTGACWSCRGPESSGGATICSPARLPAPGLWNSPPTTVRGPGTLTLQREEEEVVRHHVDSTPPPAIPWAPYPHTNTSGPWLPGAAALHCFPAKPGGYSGKPGSIRWGQQLGALAGMGVVSLMHFGLQTFRRVLPFWGCGWRPGKGPHVALRGRLCGGNFCQY